MAKPETLQKQYEEVCRSFRAIDEFRAKLMGFLPLASGVGWIALATSKDALPKAIRILVGIVGAIITVGLYIYEARGAQRCLELKGVARNLEKQLRARRDLGPVPSRTGALSRLHQGGFCWHCRLRGRPYRLGRTGDSFTIAKVRESLG